MTMEQLNRQVKANSLRNVPTKLHRLTSLPEWLELLHDQLVDNTEVNSLLFLENAVKVRDFTALKSSYFVYLMEENKLVVRSLYGKYDDKVNKQVEDVLDLAIDVHTNGGNLEALKNAAYSAANSAAYSAANSAYSAAYSAAYTKHTEKLMELLEKC